MGRSSIVTTAKLINQSVSLQCFMMIQDKRQKPRVRFSNGMKVQIVASDGAWQHSCEIIDISETGAKLWFSNLLEMAARDAELWLSEARSEAASVVQAGRDDAERLLREARIEADEVLARARDAVAQERANLEQRKTALEAEVARLGEIAAGYRIDLRRHLTELLERVDAHPEDTDPS